MILLYHKVHPVSSTIWWVDCDNFYRQMTELADKKIVYLDEYDQADPDQVVITFDGVYQNVVEYALPILSHFGYPFELFVTGDYVGKGNEFDAVEPLAPFADQDGLRRLVSAGGRLQWHTASHMDLQFITNQATISAELDLPGYLRELDSNGYNWFAYPNGTFNEVVVDLVRKKFIGAVSCHQGNDNDRYVLNRITVTNDTRFVDRKISVIVPCYNYGAYLSEAVESILRQTVPPDEIIIADDCSDDNTSEVVEYYSNKFSTVISYFSNNTNLGVISNFNKAVKLCNGDYICIVGADNRISSNYIEECVKILDLNSNVAIAYTDYALFGPRAKIVYEKFDQKLRMGRKESFFLIQFPEFSQVEKSSLSRQNIMHGSSMFRKQAFYEVGGYRDEGGMPEDQNLFLRIVTHGWDAGKATKAFLEYRQHSRGQINELHIALNQLSFYKIKCKDLEGRLQLVLNSKLCRLSLRFASLLSKFKRFFLRGAE